MINLNDWGLGLWVGLAVLPLGMLALLFAHVKPKLAIGDSGWSLIVVWLMAGGMATNLANNREALMIAVVGLGLSVIISSSLREYYRIVPGLLIAMGLTIGAGIGWSWCFLQSLPLSTPTKVLMIFNYGLGCLTVIAGLITFLPSQAFLLRKIWHRPRTAPPLQARSVYPKISVHVPCYAEPPDIVCATLAAIAELDYPNFEVLLVDNNTDDPNLWQPVQAYCDQLNQLAKQARFRFFHVENLAGAKAGALNFALCHTDADASLIAVVDADYQVNPDFLGRLVGCFDDPGIGFVQTPHDYRDWQTNNYLRGCYWEYMSFFRLQLAGLNEWVASYIIGTMCVVRKAALEEVGGWAQWCLTEDSELAVRIHGAGYRSLFLTESFGRGLIPETFRDYKKQRLRWTIGPIQQLQLHWRLYLPKPCAKPSQLTPWQKCLELSHSAGGLMPLLLLIFVPLNLGAIASLQINQQTIPMPPIVWFGAVMMTGTGLLNVWLTYWLLGCQGWQDMGLAILATISLQHIRFVGSWQAVFGRSPQWKRTNKFQVFPDRWRALQSCQTELILGIICLFLAGALSPIANPEPNIIWALVLGFLLAAIAYFATGLMAWLGERELQRTLASLSSHKTLNSDHNKSTRLTIMK